MNHVIYVYSLKGSKVNMRLTVLHTTSAPHKNEEARNGGGQTNSLTIYAGVSQMFAFTVSPSGFYWESGPRPESLRLTRLDLDAVWHSI